MNIKRLIFFGVGFLLILGVGLGTTYLCLKHFVYSRRTEMSKGMLSAHGWSNAIGLTKAQEEKLKPLETSLKKDVKGLQLKLARERMVLCSLLREGDSGSEKLDEYISRVGALESQQQRRVVQHLMAVRDILTSDQKDKFFSAIMQDICQSCRTTIGIGNDVCGMCAIPKGKSQ